MGHNEYVSAKDVVDGKIIINGNSYNIIEITDDYIQAKAEDEKNDSFMRLFCRPPHEREEAKKKSS